MPLAAVGALVVGLVAYREAQVALHPVPDPAAVPPEVLAEVTGVPATVSDRVGVGSGNGAPRPIRGAPPLASAGRPLIVYEGAEYCPYCAAERWVLVVALSRFGTWRGLEESESSPLDVDGGTATFTFVHTSYSSRYLVFDSVEVQSNRPAGFLGAIMGSYASLQRPTPLEKHLMDTYDRAPYVATAGEIPFVDVANRFVLGGSSFDPAELAGLSHRRIAADLADPTSPVARAVVGSANVFEAAVCRATNGQPASVCTSPGVQAAHLPA